MTESGVFSCMRRSQHRKAALETAFRGHKVRWTILKSDGSAP